MRPIPAPCWGDVVQLDPAARSSRDEEGRHHNTPIQKALQKGEVMNGKVTSASVWLLGEVMLLTALLPGQTWTQLGPIARSQPAVVFNPATNQMLVFGGEGPNGPFNDIWQTQLATSAPADLVWQQLNPIGPPPPPRFGHTAIYNSLSGAVTVFGGNSGSICLNDTWSLTSGNTWYNLSRSGSWPAARTNHAATYDPSTNRMIVFGGYDCRSGFFNDTWMLAGGTWAALALGGTPPPARENASLVYDPSANALFLFGGDNGSQYLGDTWELINANGTGGMPTWMLLSGAGPPARSGHIAVYNPNSDSMTMFGGTDGPGVSGVLSDTWTLSGLSIQPSWAQVSAQGDTLPRAFAAGVLNPATDQLFVFGGIIAHNSTYLDDHIFCLQLGSSPKWTHKGIRSRYGHTAVFDPNTREIIVFGGQHTFTFGNLNDTFTGVLTPGTANLEWTNLSPSQHPPPARWGHGATYNPGSNVMTVFGGGTGLTNYGPCLNDVWLLSNANVLSRPSWSEASSAGTAPSARAGHGTVYDPLTDSMVVFGGTDCNGGYLNDVWLLSPADAPNPTWQELFPGGPAPAGRDNAVVLYDAAGTLIVFGGRSATGSLNDVWVLTHASGGGSAAWRRLAPTGTPPPARNQASGVYDPGSNAMTVCYGNADGGGLLSDCWALSGANGQGMAAWSRLAPTGSVAARRAATAVWENGEMALFGGAVTSEFTPSDDHTYVLTGSP